MSSTKPQKKSVKHEERRIKTEKADLFPISHYVDDRVELVKQIFSSLKGKTIRNLAPKFLKESSIEEIEELCLNELLGLSQKRLLAIINATKCPTDTESSSDSDVRNIEEHISLEEISSDSETEKNGASKAKKTKKKRTATQPQNVGATDKSVSVLELLELQARARAIRSQLALEPVAKIEVDSDDSTNEAPPCTESRNASSSKTKESNKSAQLIVKATTNGTGSKLQKTRIKLKRNFRKRNDTENVDLVSKTLEKEAHGVENKDVAVKISETVIKEPSPDRDEIARSSSPDVITILPSPELLCISDSSEEDESTIKNVSSQSTMPQKHIDESSRNLQSGQVANQANALKTGAVDGVNVNQISGPENRDSLTNKPEELEDGEIVDGKESLNAEDMSESADAELSTRLGRADNKPLRDESEKQTVEKRAEAEEQLDELDKCDTESNCNQTNIEQYSIKSEMLISARLNDNAGDDNQQNDDVISLGNEDLDDDLQVGSTSESNVKSDAINLRKEGSKCTELTANEPLDNDIINLDNSSDEESTFGQFSDGNQSQSWNCRWLKSNRVSKILATSRLGNRVREKIKKSKRVCESAEEIVTPDQPKEVFQSQFEDGSVQQYAEILEKTS